MREVLAIVFEFILSLLVIGGGGWMIFTGHSNDFVVGTITMVLTFWFNRRQTESLLNRRDKQDQTPNNKGE